MVVAITTLDKPEANPDRIKQGLADHGLVPEDWGGDTVTVPVSAKTREGLPHLLEMLLLQADLLELKANPDKPARGIIVEAKLDRGRGAVATVLVQEGTLHPGDPFVCGPNAGRVRAMIDDKGQKVAAADPSTPVEILGLSAVPEAGSSFVVVADEATARQVADHRLAKHREASLLKTAKVSLEDLYRQVQAGDTKELRIVIKADVQGSVEALSEALTRLSTEEVRLNVLHASVGGITESDVMLASASNAVVIGFNVRPESKATAAAEREGVDVRLYTIIYEALNELRDAMEGLLEPTFREKVQGRAEVRDTFSIPGIGTIAGCFVSDGKVTRNAAARLVRDHVVVYTGKISSLRRFKDDAREVQSGYECGIGLDNFQDLKVGDVIVAYVMELGVRRLGPAMARGAAAERSL
jgi:translation initiation factor IF-2